MKNKTKGKQGFASMSPERRKEVARKGGLSVSQNAEHMAEIGRKGGERSGEIRRDKMYTKKSL